MELGFLRTHGENILSQFQFPSFNLLDMGVFQLFWRIIINKLVN